ncbi:MAG: lamin tail domain-containing protein, partial [Prevotella sp.]|nr:lamin tail domain-containing protein [Prevotella sp.]
MLKYLRFSWLFGLLCLLPYSASAVAPTAENVIVNEIMAANVDQFWSPSVNFDGWIELYNPTGEAATMAGIYMSDDPANLKKWKAPSNFGFIPAHGYKVVWFDYTHLCNTNTNFKLDVDGGTIYISDANGQLITSQAYPEAMERISYARITDGGEEWGYTAEPTPGTTNNNGVYATQQLDIPEVSHPDQLFNGSITVRVNIPDGVTLRYTTDGTLPTMTNGMTSNTGRFVVSRTTCYRFRYFQNGKLPSRVAS